jgi:hypothetical protein
MVEGDKIQGVIMAVKLQVPLEELGTRFTRSMALVDLHKKIKITQKAKQKNEAILLQLNV